MGCMLRSDSMTQCEVFLQPETAFGIISQLGEMGCVQFTDLNEELNAFQKTYVLEICRLAEMARKLRYIEEKMIEEQVYVPKLYDEPPALELHETPPYEIAIDKWERFVMEMTENLKSLSKTYLELSEMSYVLNDVGEMLGNANISQAPGLEAVKKAIKGDKKGGAGPVPVLDSESRLTVITGLVLRRRSYAFELMLWRLARGNIFYKQADEDRIFMNPSISMNTFQNSIVRKVAFLIVVQGDALGERVKKVCEGFRCDLYPLPPTSKERNLAIGEINIRLVDLYQVLSQTKLQRAKAMREIAKNWPTYSLRIRKAKAVYHTMNKFNLDITKKCLIGQCWIPTSELERVQNMFHGYSQKMETAVPSFLSKVVTYDVPPTYHRTNRFTHGFQALINAYGESTYRELNPGLFTVITFPFLFSLMFGDMGHGAIMLCVALWMVINEKKFIAQKSDSEMWIIFFGGRYIMLLMSLFSIYAGFIYNDCFSKAFTIFKSGWTIRKSIADLALRKNLLLEPSDHTAAYYIGKDPAWELAENKILFENSLKMKFSIIIGVMHMLFGLTLSLVNDIYFKKRYLILLEFIPQVLFLMCIFLWLVTLIFVKWFKYGGASPPTVSESQGCAPLVLILFIDMVLMKTSKPLGPECDAYMFGPQEIIQKVLLFVAAVSVPIMLFGPPCFVAQVNKKKRAILLKKIPREEHDPKGYEDWKRQMQHYSETFAELMIHQAVHTIEFVLSTISHTASYLRLWALSLAHAQLSEMLWVMIFHKGLSDHTYLGAVKIVPVFSVWAFFTVSILVLMEGLSAFLHTLRLHWVEFMSKFYIGGGVMFRPFSFVALFGESTKDKAEVCPTLNTFEF